MCGLFDAYLEVAGRFGIAPDRAQNFHADGEGTRLNYTVTANAITTYRESGVLADDWACEIEEDYVRRGGKSKGQEK